MGDAPAPAEEQAPDFGAIFGTDVDTGNIDLVPGLIDEMTRDEAAKVYPAVKSAKGDVVLDIKKPGLARVELVFVKDKVSSLTLQFTEKASTAEGWTALVKALEAKFGPLPASQDRNGDKLDWHDKFSDPEVKASKGPKGFEVSVPIDFAPGKSKPFDAEAFLGDAKGKVPAFFAPYKAASTRDDAVAELGKSSPVGKVESFDDGATVHPREGAQFHTVKFSNKGTKLEKIEFELNRSDSSREKFLALRDAFAKKLGAPTKRQPANATDAETEWFFWNKLDMRFVGSRIAIIYKP